MGFIEFNIRNKRGLHHAALATVPNLLVICGPNGAGKSTLLHTLFSNRDPQPRYQRGMPADWVAPTKLEPGTRVSYIGPTRPWARTFPNARALQGLRYTYRDAIEGVHPESSLPGVNAPLNPIDPGSVIAAIQYAKSAIVQIVLQHNDLVTDTYARLDEVPKGYLPDLLAPLRDLVATLLPHLCFSKLDLSDMERVRCVFEKRDSVSPVEVDIDDLSSGEQSVIALFLPFVEAQVARLIANSKAQSPIPEPKVTAIIDEPELHLHPALQLAMLTYIRDLARRGEAQFILATHSPVLMDHLEDDELYVLLSPAQAGGGNQLHKLASSVERLETLREITGSTYVATRGRPIVFVEGERPDARTSSDQRLIELMIPEAKGWVLVSAGGRGEVVNAVEKLRDPLLTELPGLPVFGLIDRDQAAGAEPDPVISWPVCMVENLLLDPAAIWALLAKYREHITLASEDDVRRALRAICEAQRADEVRLRVRNRTKPFRVYEFIEQQDDWDNLPTFASDRVAEYQSRTLDKPTLIQAIADAEGEVSTILRENRETEAFRGKAILIAFHGAHAAKALPTPRAFALELAERVAAYGRLGRLVAAPVRKIRQYIPASLLGNLENGCAVLAGVTQEADALAAKALAGLARADWEADRESTVDRGELRRMVVATARALPGENGALRRAILDDVTQIGAG